jgi:hypothetical protein
MLGVLPVRPDAGEVTEMYVNPEGRRRASAYLSASYPRVSSIWFCGLLNFHP